MMKNKQIVTYQIKIIQSKKIKIKINNNKMMKRKIKLKCNKNKQKLNNLANSAIQ